MATDFSGSCSTPLVLALLPDVLLANFKVLLQFVKRVENNLSQSILVFSCIVFKFHVSLRLPWLLDLA